MVSLAVRRHAAVYLAKTYDISERRACQVMGMHRSTYRRTPKPDKTMSMTAIHRLSEGYPRFGYRKIYTLLRNSGTRISRETVRRIRKREGLQVSVKQRKKRLTGHGSPKLNRAQYPNHIWSYDFVHDRTTDGRTLKCLTVVDEFTREGLTIETARSLTATDVIRALANLFSLYGRPTYIKSDNGPEFVAKAVQRWLKARNVATHYIDPGSPWQNGHNESFNAVFRDGCLNRWAFYSVADARRVIEAWLNEYNDIRPHGSIDMMTPRAFAARHRPLRINVA